MPSIEISREQAEALARGENITIQSERPVEKFVVLIGDDVWLVEGQDDGGAVRGRVKCLTTPTYCKVWQDGHLNRWPARTFIKVERF